jgi:hypothetical protein
VSLYTRVWARAKDSSEPWRVVADGPLDLLAGLVVHFRADREYIRQNFPSSQAPPKEPGGRDAIAELRTWESEREAERLWSPFLEGK